MQSHPLLSSPLVIGVSVLWVPVTGVSVLGVPVTGVCAMEVSVMGASVTKLASASCASALCSYSSRTIPIDAAGYQQLCPSAEQRALSYLHGS